VEDYVKKNDYAVLIVVLICIVAFIGVANACETKTIYLPDGSVQICQVCKEVVMCY